MILLNRWTLASLLVILAAITYGVTQNDGQGNVASNDISLTDSPGPVPQDLEDRYESLIGQAQTEAKNNQFKQAILNLEGIPKNSQHFAHAQQVKDEFSQSLLQHANDKYQKGDIQTALAMLDAVAPSSTSSSQAKKLQKDWGEQGEQFEMVRTAIAKKDWHSALKSLDRLKGMPIFQSAQVQQLLQLATDHLGQPDKITTRTAVARMPASTDSVVTAQVSTEPATVGSETDNALAVDVKPAAISSAQPKQILVSTVPIPATAPIKTVATVPTPASETVAIVPVSEKEQTLGATEKIKVQTVKSIDGMTSHRAFSTMAREQFTTIPIEDKPSSIQERMAAFDQLRASVTQEGTTPTTMQTTTVMTAFSPFDSLPQPKDIDNVSRHLGNAVTLSTFTDSLLRNRPLLISPAFNTTRAMTINSRAPKVSDASTVRVDSSDLLGGMAGSQDDSI
ncbi:hypothetical protein AB3R30_20800 [Leptolyngbyaceae cyanobacterium UHCC 1019]